MSIFSKKPKTVIDEKPFLSKEDLQKKIDKNRDDIDKLLNGNYPLNLIYDRIRMLSTLNERLISLMKNL